MTAPDRFTDYRVPDPGIRTLFQIEERWQAWLAVEAALAFAQADVGIIPRDAADMIAETARIDLLDVGRIHNEAARVSHPLMPLITELTRVCGRHGQWVHWGATTQNIMQTGDLVLVRRAHDIIDNLLRQLLGSMAHLAEREADTVMAGRTHGQQGVPITFGFKVAVWIDEFVRHLERLMNVKPRLFVAMLGGATGNYASTGPAGPAVQEAVGRSLGLGSMAIPARTINDQMAEYVSILAMSLASMQKIGSEIITLMSTEVGEVQETMPIETVGSSTMPQKKNPQLSQDIVGIAAQGKALVPLAFEAINSHHEADGASEDMMRHAVFTELILSGDALARLNIVIPGLAVDAVRMKKNLLLTDGLIMSEAVMLGLAKYVGRQNAHEIVRRAAQTALEGDSSFMAVLLAEPSVSKVFDEKSLRILMDPSKYTGLSAQIARSAAISAREAVARDEN
ncbi:MAG: 3-carboxy-cis,cis-muconate cycloisomerase [Streptosporangiaceae bacterium]|jgi:3-carboxy-cis,cis-muconate cycloisomerase|nr:3-carboxy-cis,cis-muconate cycloisomerase [Streptosporangiaceae bacterium]